MLLVVNMTMLIVILVLNISALVCMFRYPLPRPFPWTWALLFDLALFIGGLFPLGTLERFYLFTAFLSAVIIGGSTVHLGVWKYRMALALGIGLAVFVVIDSFRLIPTIDVFPPIWNGILRRPYALAHPNLLAAWALLLPFGVWTVVIVLFSQSRGALVGLVAMLGLRYVPWLVAY
jgi:hypothetical protein